MREREIRRKGKKKKKRRERERDLTLFKTVGKEKENKINGSFAYILEREGEREICSEREREKYGR